MLQQQRESAFLPAAQLELVDPTLDHRYHLAIAHQLSCLTICSSMLWSAGFVPLHDSYSGIHDALLVFVEDVKQESCHIQ